MIRFASKWYDITIAENTTLDRNGGDINAPFCNIVINEGVTLTLDGAWFDTGDVENWSAGTPNVITIKGTLAVKNGGNFYVHRG